MKWIVVDMMVEEVGYFSISKLRYIGVISLRPLHFFLGGAATAPPRYLDKSAYTGGMIQ